MTPADMINHLEQGYTMDQIGAMFTPPRSRGSISGAIYRYRKANNIFTDYGKEQKHPKDRRAKPIELPPPKPEGFHAVLERNGCRYIEGDIRIKPVYCEGDATHGAYCEEHYKRCYVGGVKK